MAVFLVNVTLVTCLIPPFDLFYGKIQYMKKNMGSADKIIRILIALVIGFLYYKGIVTGTAGIILLVLAVVFVITSFVSFCPLYTLFGINTCKRK